MYHNEPQIFFRMVCDILVSGKIAFRANGIAKEIVLTGNMVWAAVTGSIQELLECALANSAESLEHSYYRGEIARLVMLYEMDSSAVLRSVLSAFADNFFHSRFSKLSLSKLMQTVADLWRDPAGRTAEPEGRELEILNRLRAELQVVFTSRHYRLEPVSGERADLFLDGLPAAGPNLFWRKIAGIESFSQFLCYLDLVVIIEEEECRELGMPLGRVQCSLGNNPAFFYRNFFSLEASSAGITLVENAAPAELLAALMRISMEREWLAGSYVTIFFTNANKTNGHAMNLIVLENWPDLSLLANDEFLLIGDTNWKDENSGFCITKFFGKLCYVFGNGAPLVFPTDSAYIFDPSICKFDLA
jgi:hypothetical protein